MPRRPDGAEHRGDGPREWSAAGPQRAEPEVERFATTAVGRASARPRAAAPPTPRRRRRPPRRGARRRRRDGPRSGPASGRSRSRRAPCRRSRRAVGRSARRPRRRDASEVRGRSTTTVSCPRRAAESASRTAKACRVWAPAPTYHDSTPSDPDRGSASRNARALSRPVVWHSASHRKPSVRSSPSIRSRPGPCGSQSITTASPARAAPCPSAQANVVAPAPPDPPMTPITRPRVVRRSVRSASSSTSQADDPASSTTCSAPSSSAVRNRSSGARWCDTT